MLASSSRSRFKTDVRRLKAALDMFCVGLHLAVIHHNQHLYCIVIISTSHGKCTFKFLGTFIFMSWEVVIITRS